MEVEIRPEPTPEERAAIVAALYSLTTGATRPCPSPWWQEGLEESLDDDRTG